MTFLTIIMPFQNCAKQGSTSDSTKTSVNESSSTELIPSNTAVNTASSSQNNSNQTSNDQSNSANNNNSTTTNNNNNGNSNNTSNNNNSNNNATTDGTPVPATELFTILPGTGTKSWNTSKTPMVVYVGQTLKITNNDSIPHRLHTTGKPCPHQPTNTAPNGETFDFVISSDTSTASTVTMVDFPLYDHLVPKAAAKFYLRVYDGPKIYEQKCSRCHTSLSTSEVRGNDVTNINWALKNIARMKMANIVLTPQEIEALEIALRN